MSADICQTCGQHCDCAERLLAAEINLSSAQATIAELRADIAGLLDPVAVYANMLRGKIAMPRTAQLDQAEADRDRLTAELAEWKATAKSHIDDAVKLTAGFNEELAELRTALATVTAERDEAVKPWKVILLTPIFQRLECEIIDVGHADRILMVNCQQIDADLAALRTSADRLAKAIMEAKVGGYPLEELSSSFKDALAEYRKLSAPSQPSNL